MSIRMELLDVRCKGVRCGGKGRATVFHDDESLGRFCNRCAGSVATDAATRKPATHHEKK